MLRVRPDAWCALEPCVGLFGIMVPRLDLAPILVKGAIGKAWPFKKYVFPYGFLTFASRIPVRG